MTSISPHEPPKDIHILLRLGLATLVHLAFAAIGAGLIWFTIRDEASLIPAVQERFAADPATLDQVLTDASGHVQLWCALSLIISLILTVAWLVHAEQAGPVDDDQAKSRGGSWALLMMVTLGAALLIGYLQVWRTAVNLRLNTHAIVAGGGVTVAAVLLAYVVATALGVKQTMRPSVLFGLLLLP